MAQAENKGIAEIHYSTEGATPTVELVVPHGTHLSDMAKLLDMTSREVISKISPRGCQQCTSGVHLTIRERFQEVIRADIGTGTVIR
jgi:hypothetical protein